MQKYYKNYYSEPFPVLKNTTIEKKTGINTGYWFLVVALLSLVIALAYQLLRVL